MVATLNSLTNHRLLTLSPLLLLLFCIFVVSGRHGDTSLALLPVPSSVFLQRHRHDNEALIKFDWIEQTTPCSVTCGLGVAGVTYKCYSMETGEFVDDKNCNNRHRPITIRRSCKLSDCEPRWEIGLWEQCSANCGLGVVQRRVSCVRYSTALPHDLVSSSSSLLVTNQPPVFEQVPDQLCLFAGFTKPRSEKRCPHQKCSHWRVAAWSTCSSSCGSGVQFRRVRCYRKRPERLPCDHLLKPSSRRPCLVRTCPSKDNTKLSMEAAHHRPELTIKLPSHDITPKYHTGGWGRCSRTCGSQSGVQYRVVQCRRYFPELRIHADVPQAYCDGQRKPNATRQCKTRYMPCGKTVNPRSLSERRFRSFKWMESGYSTCSTTCGGGYRKKVVLCFGLVGNIYVPAEDFHCANKTRPIEMYEMCGMDLCSPEWQISNTSQCSVSCGHGLKFQTTKCIRKQLELNRNEELPDFMCSQQERPPSVVTCQSGACKPLWKAERWSKCSEPCGIGWQVRNISCILPIRVGYYEPMPSSACGEQIGDDRMPITARRCVTLASCVKPEKQIDTSTHIFLNDAGEMISVLGGQINVLSSKYSSLILICPAPAHSLVTWLKDGEKIPSQWSRRSKGSLLYVINPVLSTSRGKYSCSVASPQKKFATTVISSEVIVYDKAKTVKHKFGIGSTTLFGWKRVEDLIENSNQNTRQIFQSLIATAWNQQLEASVYLADKCLTSSLGSKCTEMNDNCMLGCAVRRGTEPISDKSPGNSTEVISFVHRDICRQLELLHSSPKMKHQNRTNKANRPSKSKTPLLRVPYSENCRSNIKSSWTMQRSGPCDTKRCLNNLNVAIIDLSVRCQPLNRPDLGTLYLDESYCPTDERPLDYTFCLAPGCSKKRRRK